MSLIVWLNGPFGVGKSTTARVLAARLPGSAEFNPERLGWLVKRTLGVIRRGDYQDVTLWRSGTVRLAARRARAVDTLVVAMAVLRPDYLDEISAGLSARGHRLHHVLLDASPERLRRRIEADIQDPAARAWRLGQLDVYLTVRAHLLARGAVVDTDDLAPDRVADAVAATIT